VCVFFVCFYVYVPCVRFLYIKYIMSGKDFLKSHVLSWRRKVYSDFIRLGGNGQAGQLHAPGPMRVRARDRSGHHQGKLKF